MRATFQNSTNVPCCLPRAHSVDSLHFLLLPARTAQECLILTMVVLDVRVCRLSTMPQSSQESSLLLLGLNNCSGFLVTMRAVDASQRRQAAHTIVAHMSRRHWGRWRWRWNLRIVIFARRVETCTLRWHTGADEAQTLCWRVRLRTTRRQWPGRSSVLRRLCRSRPVGTQTRRLVPIARSLRWWCMGSIDRIRSVVHGRRRRRLRVERIRWHGCNTWSHIAWNGRRIGG